MHGLRRQRLEQLLRSLFEVEGLYRFLHALGREIGDSLRPRLSLIELVTDATALIERHGCHGELFVRLTRARPPAYQQIVVVAALFGVQVERPTRPKVPTTATDSIRALLGRPDGLHALFS